MSQLLLPGLVAELSSVRSADSEAVAGCCVVDLANSTTAGCCCGPKVKQGCGCVGGGEYAGSRKTVDGQARSPQPPRTFESEICGCGGKHRLGLVASSEPAVLPTVEERSARQSDPRLPEVSVCWCVTRLTPPTPPPEFLS
ncbi:MAG: hypothetical protein O3B13_14660 [Planctomycetota bacterium]|nr:hypothetical protein [Planctomycetota bacterium]MDA1164334.1 hypothetical protein [Planctomycetota bacterium]